MGTAQSATVRFTHWTVTFSFIGLLVSGIAILLAHPRLYWGETGGVGGPSLLDLPLPFMLNGQTGWGRSLHFLSAWICVLAGTLYVASGLIRRHFRQDLLPANEELKWDSLSREISNHLRFWRPIVQKPGCYNVLQRLTYLAVIFIGFPSMIWTGLAMSPAVTSVAPALATLLGGQQSARTIHFFAACLLVLFMFIHVGMVFRAGFVGPMRAMITGRVGLKERHEQLHYTA